LAEPHGWRCEFGGAIPQHVVRGNDGEASSRKDNRIDTYSALRSDLEELPQDVSYNSLNAGVEVRLFRMGDFYKEVQESTPLLRRHGSGMYMNGFTNDASQEPTKAGVAGFRAEASASIEAV
jgi:hypothetical protein